MVVPITPCELWLGGKRLLWFKENKIISHLPLSSLVSKVPVGKRKQLTNRKVGKLQVIFPSIISTIPFKQYAYPSSKDKTCDFKGLSKVAQLLSGHALISNKV